MGMMQSSTYSMVNVCTEVTAKGKCSPVSFRDTSMMMNLFVLVNISQTSFSADVYEIVIIGRARLMLF